MSFLDQYNPIGRSDIYETEQDLESAVEGVLTGFLYSHGLNGESTEAFPIASGLVHWGVSTQRLTSNKWLSCLRFTQYSSNDWNGYNFRAMYVPVFRANALLAGLEDSPVDVSYKKEIEAEARFYRAVAYFYLVRKWGDVPLRLEEVDFDNANAKPRSPYYKVYAQIVSDLEFAAAYMRSPKRVDEIGAAIVRSNRFAAIAYLSSVYTTIGSLLASPDDNFWDASKEGRSPDFSDLGVTTAENAYVKALEYAESLIPESDTYNPACGYRLLTKFGDLFTYDPSFSRDGYTSFKHPEQVLTIPVSVAADASNTYAQYQLPQYPEGTDCKATNEQYGRIRPTRWAFQKWCSTYPGEWRNSNHTEYISSSDPRLDKTFYYNSMDYASGYTYNGQSILGIYPATLSYSRLNMFPYFRKYASKSYSVTTGDADIYAMRFAEVYFNAIEAAAYLGDTDKAYKYMDVIHARARHSVDDGEPDSEYPKWTAGEFPDRESLLNRIFWERIFEFFGEDHEYYETHRHGATWLVENIAKPKNAFMALSNQAMLYGVVYPQYMSGTTDKWFYSESVEQARRGLLAGFPINEILYNSGIEDNGRNDFDFGI